MAATKLTVYLVNKADDFGGLFDATHRAKAATILEGFFGDVIKLCPTRYNAVDVKWDGKKGDPTANDLVCYVLTSSASSIVSGKGSVGSLGPSGTTGVATVDKSMISEIYLRQVVQGGDPRGGATGNRENAVAAICYHELAHNILDASSPLVTDVHKMTGGVVLRDTDTKPLADNETPNAKDNTTFATGFTRRANGVKQYVDDMPT